MHNKLMMMIMMRKRLLGGVVLCTVDLFHITSSGWIDTIGTI